jgi:hypothetical protein
MKPTVRTIPLDLLSTDTTVTCQYCGITLPADPANWRRTHKCLDGKTPTTESTPEPTPKPKPKKKRRPIPKPVPADISNITAGITTFLRPENLESLLASLPPNLNHIIEDTEGNLSAGRNKLVDKCPTEYFLLLEDDFEFTHRTNPAILRSVLESDSEIAGISGAIEDINKPPFAGHDFVSGNDLSQCFDIFRNQLHHRPSWYPWRITPEGIPYLPCHFISNFSLFRTEYLKRIQWNEDLPIYEHEEFFVRCWKENNHLMAFCPEVRILHYRDSGNQEYKSYRYRDGVPLDRELGYKIVRHRKPDPLPCFVVATGGFTGSRLIAKVLGKLLDVSHDLDKNFAEVNVLRHYLTQEDPEGFAKALRKLPKPWVIKDPRMVYQWKSLLPVFADYEPVLVLSTRCARKTYLSYKRREMDVSYQEVERRAMMAADWYHCWPWRKIEVDLNEVASILQEFNPSRVTGREQTV